MPLPQTSKKNLKPAVLVAVDDDDDNDNIPYPRKIVMVNPKWVDHLEMVVTQLWTKSLFVIHLEMCFLMN